MDRKTSHGPFSSPAHSLLAVDLPIDDHMATSRGLAATVAMVVVIGIRGGMDRGWDSARVRADGGNIKPLFRAQPPAPNFFPS